MKKQKKRKTNWGQWIMMISFMLIGGICGILMMEYIDKFNAAEKSAAENITTLILLFLGMYVAMFLQIIIHEAGHLVFGLVTGYRFSSFRIGSFMWINENGKLRFKRLSLAGTGGQCLMNPPKMVDGKIPYVLYNLGGSVLNTLSAVLFIVLFVICRDNSVYSILLLMLAVIGIAFALTNGIPMRMGSVNNDGHNALSLGKDPEALRSFWVQMKVSNEQIYGIRLKDMPAQWFEIPSDESMKNSMTAVMGVFAANRLMDEQRFDEADRLMEHFMQIESGIVGVHRSLMNCDRVFCELINENKREVINMLMSKEQKKFMRSMKNFPSVVRTEYALALLHENDSLKAEKFKQQFDKIAKTYPYASDIQSERELIELAELSKQQLN